MKKEKTGIKPPRVYATITREQEKELDRIIPWGLKVQLVAALLEAFIQFANNVGPDQAIAAILARNMKMEDLLKRIPKDVRGQLDIFTAETKSE